MISITVFIILFYLSFLTLKTCFKRWKKLKNLSSIPGPKRRSFFLGNLDIFQEAGKPLNYTIGQRLMGLAKVYEEEGLFKFFIGTKPIVCVFRPKFLKQILGTSGQIEKPDAVVTLRHGLGNGLGTADGLTWRKNRKLIMPTFSTRVLNGYLPVFNHHSNQLCESISKLETITDFERLALNSSLDLICETAMGVKPDGHENDPTVTNQSQTSEEKNDPTVTNQPRITEEKNDSTVTNQSRTTEEKNDPTVTNQSRTTEEKNDPKKITQEMYTKSLQKFTEILVKRIFTPWLEFDSIFFWTDLGKEFEKHVQRIHQFTMRIIREKSSEIDTSGNSDTSRRLDMKKNEIDEESANVSKVSRQVAFLDLLLQLRKEGLMSEEEIRSEVDTFAFAGHDTVAITTTFALFEIGNNVDVQKKLFQEVVEVFGSPSNENFLRDSSSEDLKKLEFMECVIKEVLRLYPAGPTVGRVLTSDVELEEHFLPTGTEVWFLISALHMNRNIFSDPLRFDPNRFKKKNFDTFSFAPFSAGIRNCVGNRFAVMAIKTILSALVRRFKITSFDTRDKLILNFELILRPKNKIKIKFESRF